MFQCGCATSCGSSSARGPASVSRWSSAVTGRLTAEGSTILTRWNAVSLGKFDGIVYFY